MNRMTHFAVALAAGLLVAVGATAQDDESAEAPDTYIVGEAGEATHKATGAVCPVEMGDLVLVQVLSIDRESDHLGLVCQYQSALGFDATVSFLRADEPGLVGAGDSAARWNRSLYTILGSYPGALPANVADLEGDAAAGMRGALFTANANGIPVRIGLWQMQRGEWQFTAQTTFAPTSADSWALARATRDALLAAKAAADAS